MKNRKEALDALERVRNKLPERVFMDADKKFYGIYPGNDRSVRLMQERDILHIIHSAIGECRILNQIVTCNKEAADER